MMEHEARLHPGTVEHAEEHLGAFSGPRKRSAGPRSSRVATATVPAEVMAAAKLLAAARPGTRVRIVDAGTVIVENDPHA